MSGNIVTQVDLINHVAKIVHIVTLVYKAHKLYQRSKRRRSVRPSNLSRKDEGFDKTCVLQLKKLDEEQFFKVTPMNVNTFKLLLSLLNEKMERFSNRKAIDAEIRLAVTLSYLAQGCNVKILARNYKLGLSTVRKIIYETCETIWDELNTVYLVPPNVNDFMTISDQFYIKTGMPNCLGAIDGKHVKIVCPNKSGSLYFDNKRTFSIVLKAACDANYIFTYVDVGALGSQSDDDDIPARNEFASHLLNGTLEIPNPSNLPGTSTEFPYYFVGDNAFPLKSNIMRPYPENNISEDKNKFNTILSKARVHIENTFGILANRWRILHTKLQMSPKNAEKIVLATVVLHNFLMLQEDGKYFTTELVDHSIGNQEIQGQWRQEIKPLTSHRTGMPNRSTAAAYKLRDQLKDYLQNN